MPAVGPAAVPGAAAHVFVADVAEPELDDSDRHHLERVLRLRRGDVVTAGDGQGRWRVCRVSAGPGAGLGAGLEAESDVVAEPRPSPDVTVAFSPTKGDRPEWAVQKLTELGVDRVVVFSAARSVVRWEGDRGRRAVERLRRVARAAAMQSRRAWLPVVEGPSGFAEVAARPGAALADAGGQPPWLAPGPVLVGPEGGWSPDEAAREGLAHMALGPHVLRAETAAVTVAALLGGLRAGLVAPAGEGAPGV
ncbi:MAG: 16S rRNA (uracil(1498)-N(3))-methyltransferase [Acidimicrobiales bacterium]